MKKIKERLVNLWNYFTTYEKVWFFSILILSVIFAFLFPEEDVNGVNGKIIMTLYLLDIFFNILCELLIGFLILGELLFLSKVNGTLLFHYLLR